MVTTSDHVLMNMAGFGDDREIDGDVLVAKRSHDDDEHIRCECDRTPRKSASSQCDADAVPAKRRRRGTYHLPRPPTKNNPPAFIQLSPGFAVRVEDAATCGYPRIWCFQS